jgi:hypothetical protein
MAKQKVFREVTKEEPTSAPTALDKLEQISKISVPLMIPIVVALIGYFGNDFLNQRQR